MAKIFFGCDKPSIQIKSQTHKNKAVNLGLCFSVDTGEDITTFYRHERNPTIIFEMIYVDSPIIWVFDNVKDRDRNFKKAMKLR